VSFPFHSRGNPSRPLTGRSRSSRFGALALMLGLVASFVGVASNSPANAVTVLAGSPYNGTDGAPDLQLPSAERMTRRARPPQAGPLRRSPSDSQHRQRVEALRLDLRR